MTSTLIKIFVPIAFVFLISCRGNDSDKDLIGKWKPAEIQFSGGRWGEPRYFQFTDIDSIRSGLIHDLKEDEGMDSDAALLKADSAINYYRSAGLSLLSDSSFEMIGRSILWSQKIPGLSSWDTLTGNWLRLKDSLVLNIGNWSKLRDRFALNMGHEPTLKDSLVLNISNEPTPLAIKYTILKLSKDSLVLKEPTHPDNARPNEIIIFVKD